MIRRYLASSVVASVVCSSVLLGCNEGSFVGGGKKTGAVEPRRDENAKPKEPPAMPDEKPTDTFTDDGERCLKNPVDVKILFLLDATASMKASVDLVQQSIRAFADQVGSIDFNSDRVKVASVELGGIAFKDSENELERIPFGQVATVGGKIADIDPFGGGDGPEGGLLALKAGLAMLAEAKPAPGHDALPIVVVITDTYAHNGAGDAEATDFDTWTLPTRDCAVTWQPLQDQLASRAFDRLLIYDASPKSSFDSDFPGDPGFGAPRLQCQPYDNKAPSQQWDDLRALWRSLKKAPAEIAVGRGFDFPFTADALISSLPQDVKASFKACE